VEEIITFPQAQVVTLQCQVELADKGDGQI